MEPCLGGLVVNEGLEMRSCSHGCAIEGSVDGVVVNKRENKKRRLSCHHFLVIHLTVYT